MQATKLIEATVKVTDLGIIFDKLKKLNKKAEKVGAGAVILEKGETRTIKETIAAGEYRMYEVMDIRIIGDAPKLEGWTFCGTLDHITLPGAVVVKTVPGMEIPKRFFEAEAICNHCNKKRMRRDTFIVEKDGEYLQVGRQCVQDFLGHNPAQVLAYMRGLDDMAEGCEHGMGGAREWFYDLHNVLEITSACIQAFGWISRREANESFENKSATASDVMYYFEGKRNEDWKAFCQLLNMSDPKVKARCEADAKGAIEWLENQEPSNEYMHNLVSIFRYGKVSPKLFGFWCSLIVAYNKAMERETERSEKLAAIKQEYYGEIKQRLPLTLTLTGKQFIDTIYGGSTIHRFRDAEGRLFNWFASTGSDMDIGETYTVKATVKKHEEYNGNKITYINRVTVQ